MINCKLASPFSSCRFVSFSFSSNEIQTNTFAPDDVFISFQETPVKLISYWWKRKCAFGSAGRDWWHCTYVSQNTNDLRNKQHGPNAAIPWRSSMWDGKQRVREERRGSMWDQTCSRGAHNGDCVCFVHLATGLQSNHNLKVWRIRQDLH